MAKEFAINTVFKGKDELSKHMTTIAKNSAKLGSSLSKNIALVKKSAFVSAGLTAGIVVGFKKIFETGAGIEETLTDAGQRFNDPILQGTDAFKELQEQVQKTATASVFTGRQTANTVKTMAQAGLQAKQIYAILQNTSDFAVAGGFENMDTAAGLAIDTLGQYNLMTKDTIQLQKNFTRVTDVLVKGANMANTSIQDYGEALKYAGVASKTMGVSFEDTVTTLDVLASAGLRSQKAGTALRSMLSRLAKPTKEITAALTKNNIQLQDSQGNFVGMRNFIAQLQTKTKNLTTTQKNAFFATIAGQQAMSGLAILTKQGTAAFDKYKSSLSSVDGETKKFANRMAKTASVKLKAFSSAVEALQNALFLTNDSSMKSIIDEITEGVRGVTKWIGKHQELTAAILKTVAAFAAIATAVFLFGTIATGISGVIGLVGILGNLLTGIPIIIEAITIGVRALTLAIASNPLGAVLTIAAIAFAELYINSEKFRKVIKSIFKWIVDIIKKAGELLGLFGKENKIDSSITKTNKVVIDDKEKNKDNTQKLTDLNLNTKMPTNVVAMVNKEKETKQKQQQIKIEINNKSGQDIKVDPKSTSILVKQKTLPKQT